MKHIQMVRLVKQWRYKRKFPNALVDGGAYVDWDCKLGKNVRVSCGTSLSNSEIGAFTYLAANSSLSDVCIGRFCSIGPFCLVGSGDHPSNWISTSPVFYSTRKQCGVSFAAEDVFDEIKQIKIGNDVWIGARVFIRDGIKIGNGAIIAAGAVVVKDVPDYAVVGGVPARHIRYRFTEKDVLKLLDMQWWNWPEDCLRDNSLNFIRSDIQPLYDYHQRHLDIIGN